MKQKIAILTPLHPQKTGIADYIEEMLPYLRAEFGNEYQIDLFTEEPNPSNTALRAEYNILPLDSFEERRKEYVMPIYQLGNNAFHCKIYQLAMRYSGVVVLHDFAIHHMVACLYLDRQKDDAAYFRAVEENHGRAARYLAYQRAVNGELGLWETDAVDYPMNRIITKGAKGIIVFSEFVKQRIEAYQDHVPVCRVHLHCSGQAKKFSREEMEEARAKLKLRDHGETLLCAFGFIAKNKRPYSILEAARRLKEQGYRFRLVFVGELQEDCRDLPQKINEMGLTREVRITGYATAEEFDRYVCAADICISLRYPTMGENSGVLMRALRYGKPSIVTDIGSFQEIPTDTVIRIGYGESEVEELVQALEQLITKPEMYRQMSEHALAYASEYLEPQKTAEKLCDFVKELVRFDRVKEDPMYRYTRDKLLDTYLELGKCDDTVMAHITQTLEGLFGQ